MDDGVSRDGSPVAAYAALPAEPELSIVRGLLGARRHVLDLGCGTGRIADPLAAEGRDVVAVDESAEMLSHVRCARSHHSSIETLDLDESFEAVLLLSHLINGVNRRTLLDTAVRHLRPDGLLIAQRLSPDQRWQTGSSQIGAVTVGLIDVAKDGDRIAGVSRYTVGEHEWTQTWNLVELADDDATRLLEHVGLRPRTLDGAWITAVRADSQA